MQRVSLDSMSSENIDSFSSDNQSDVGSSTTHASSQGNQGQKKRLNKNWCARNSILNSKYYMVFQITLAILYFTVMIILTYLYHDMYMKQNDINKEGKASFGCQAVVPVCDEDSFKEQGCYNVKQNK